MGLVIRTALAKGDYDRIYDYIAVNNERAAANLLRTFDEKAMLLSDMPGGGPPRPDLGKEMRSYPIGNYLLLYRPIEGGIELLKSNSRGTTSAAGIPTG